MPTKPLHIIADEHIWGVASACAHLSGYDVDLHILPPKDISSEVVADADILLTRTGTKVDENLLKGSTVRFAGTATIGDDHYDKAWLDKQGIAWATAAGSSTDAVLEYVLSALLEVQHQGKVDLSNMTLGVLGAGRIGGKLVDICRAMGMNVLVNDPPRQRIEGGEDFVCLQELLQKSDIVTLHTPLIRDGEDSTYHLLDAKHLSMFKGKLLINAARGACVDNHALLDELENRADMYVVMDCWENEPAIDAGLLGHQQCLLATPHIAGHSLDGKAANTYYIYQALCAYLNIEASWQMHDDLPSINYQYDEDIVSWKALYQKVSQLYPIVKDHRALSSCASLDTEALGKQFTYLRRHYPVRRAWKQQSDVLSHILHATYVGAIR